eukprot:3318405-Pyramimonas_sp.AAC.2
MQAQSRDTDRRCGTSLSPAVLMRDPQTEPELNSMGRHHRRSFRPKDPRHTTRNLEPRPGNT